MNITSINLNLLVALDALLVERNVTRAAARVGLSQSAMSNALARLREIFGDPLFHRRARGMVPTGRALALTTPVRHGLALLSSALEPPRFDPASAERTFVLAASDHAQFVVLPPLLARLRQHAPRVRLAVVPWGAHQLPPGLAAGDIDLMIGFYDQVPQHHRAQILFEDRYVCLVRKGHPRVAGKLSLARYLQLGHIVVSERAAGPGSVDVALEKRGLRRSVGVRVPHFLLVPHLVACTDLVAAVSRRVAVPFARLLPLRVLPPPLALPAGRVGQAWHERADQDVAHRWLRETIADVARNV